MRESIDAGAKVESGRGAGWRGLGRRYDSVLYPLLALLAGVVIWHLIIVVLALPPFILPTPGSVFTTLSNEWADRIAGEMWVTFQEIIAGFTLALAIGIPLAVAMALYRPIDRAAYPLLVISQAIPKIAIAPLFLLWLGFGMTPKIAISGLIAFFPIAISTVAGLKSVPIEMRNLGISMGAGSVRQFFKIRLPYALPSMFAGLKIAMTFAVIGTVVGEFVAANRGMGYLIMISIGLLRTDLLFACLVVLAVVGVALFYAVELLERRFVRWHVSSRSEVGLTI